MHFTALLTVVAALIPAVIPVPAPSPQSAEIDVHLELNSKDLAGFFNEPENAHSNADHPLGPSLPYPFTLKGHLVQGLEIIGPEPPLPFYQFVKTNLGEEGILSRHPTTFKLHNGKLLVGDKAVGFARPFEKVPVPAVLVSPQHGLKFATQVIGGKKITLRFADQRFTFLGSKFVSGIGDHVEAGFRPIIWPHPTIITWEVVRAGPKKNNSEDEFVNKVSIEDYDQEVFAEDHDQDVSAEI